MDKKDLTINEYQLSVSISKEDDGSFFAQCTNWKDCYAQGDTIEEAINEITYVAGSLIELYSEENIQIPLELKKKTKEPSNGFTFTFPLIVSSPDYA